MQEQNEDDNQPVENSAVRYKLGKFVFDVASRTLIHGSNKVELTPKVYALLVLLVNSNGRVVSKEEICQSVWSNRIVTDTTIYKVIEKIRFLLGDNSENPIFIKTIHGEGYQFCYQVAEKKNVIKTPRSLKWLGVGLMALLVISIFFLLRPTPALPIKKVYVEFSGSDIDRNVFSFGLAKFVKDFLYAHFSNYKKQYRFNNTGSDLTIVHVLGSENNDLVLQVDIKHGGQVISSKRIIADSEQQLLSDYIGFLKNNRYISGHLINALMATEFSDSIEQISQFIQGLGYFELQKNHQASVIFKAIDEQSDNFLWVRLYHSLASRRTVDLSSSLGSLIQIDMNQASDYLLMMLHRVMGFSHFTVGNYDEARNYFLTAKGLAQELQQDLSLVLIGVGFYKLALIKYDFEEAEKYLSRATLLAKSINNTLLINNMHKNNCEYHKTRFNIDNAIEFCMQALNGYEDLKKPVFALQMGHYLSELYLQRNDVVNARKYNDKSIEQSQVLDNHNGLNRAYLQKIKIALNSGALQEAQDAFYLMAGNVKEIDHASTNKFIHLARFLIKAYQNDASAVTLLEKYGRYVSEKNLVTYYPFIKEQARYYLQQQQYEKAAQLLDQALKYQNADDDPELALLLFQLPNHSVTQHMLKQAAINAKNRGLLKLEQDTNQQLEKIF